MWRSKKFILIAALAAVLLAGSTVGAVLAQDETDGTSPAQTVFERAAAILGANGTSITAEELEAAFTRARQEMQDETTDSRLKSLVDAGRITEEQADQFKAWLAQRPDTTQFREQMKDWRQARPTAPPGLKDWLQAKPDMPQGLAGGRALRGGMRNFMMGRQPPAP